jgi:hypothetical protein
MYPLFTVAIIIGMVCFFTIRASNQRERLRQDATSGVEAWCQDLRLTRNSLWVGHGPQPRVFTIRGAVATVQDAAHGRSAYLSINGPGMTLLREIPSGQAVRLAGR